MNGEYSLYSKRKGRPGKIEKDIGVLVYNIFKEHGKSYMSKDLISGIILCSIGDAIAECRTFKEF